MFGTAEYPALLKSNLEQERVFKYKVLADDDEVAKNYFLVNEDGGSILNSQSRTSDDFQYHNETCEELNIPNRYCQGRNYAFKRSPIRPPCIDNNSSINALSGCVAPMEQRWRNALLSPILPTHSSLNVESMKMGIVEPTWKSTCSMEHHTQRKS